MKFLDFARAVWPTFSTERYIEMPHVQVMATVFDRIAAGEEVDAVFLLPERTGKTLNASILFPAYLIATAPSRRIGIATQSPEVAEGRVVQNIRNVLNTSEAHSFGTTPFEVEGKRSRRDFHVAAKGHPDGAVFGIGTGGALGGWGFNVTICDDPHDPTLADLDYLGISEEDRQEDLASDWRWLSHFLFVKTLPKGSRIVCMTPIAKGDAASKMVELAADRGGSLEVYDFTTPIGK